MRARNIRHRIGHTPSERSAIWEIRAPRLAYPPAVDLGADPFLETLRDVLGALRIVYSTATDERAREALKKAGEAMGKAHDLASRERHEKERPLALRRARMAIREASEAVAAHVAILGGALARVPSMRRLR